MFFRSSFALTIVFGGKWFLTQYGVYGANKLWDESDFLVWKWQQLLTKAFDEVIINYFIFAFILLNKVRLFFYNFLFQIQVRDFSWVDLIFGSVLEFVIKTSKNWQQEACVQTIGDINKPFFFTIFQMFYRLLLEILEIFSDLNILFFPFKLYLLWYYYWQLW